MSFLNKNLAKREKNVSCSFRGRHVVRKILKKIEKDMEQSPPKPNLISKKNLNTSKFKLFKFYKNPKSKKNTYLSDQQLNSRKQLLQLFHSPFSMPMRNRFLVFGALQSNSTSSFYSCSSKNEILRKVLDAHLKPGQPLN